MHKVLKLDTLVDIITHVTLLLDKDIQPPKQPSTTGRSNKPYDACSEQRSLNFRDKMTSCTLLSVMTICNYFREIHSMHHVIVATAYYYYSLSNLQSKQFLPTP